MIAADGRPDTRHGVARPGEPVATVACRRPASGSRGAGAFGDRREVGLVDAGATTIRVDTS